MTVFETGNIEASSRSRLGAIGGLVRVASGVLVGGWLEASRESGGRGSCGGFCVAAKSSVAPRIGIVNNAFRTTTPRSAVPEDFSIDLTGNPNGPYSQVPDAISLIFPRFHSTFR
jgi:hypothetical protein